MNQHNIGAAPHRTHTIEAKARTAAPGSTPRVTLIDYTPERVVERVVTDPAECEAYRKAQSITWVNVDGLQDPAVLERLSKAMGFHSLTLEDILNTDVRPKFEDYGEYIYIVAKMLEVDRENDRIRVDQLSLVLGPSYVVSIQEEPGDPFEPVRNRIRNAAGRLRRSGPDYLAHALLDLIVDQYFAVADWVGDRIEALDESITEDERDLMQQLYALKRTIIFLRKTIFPLRDVVSTLRNIDSDLLRESTQPYLRDLHDHLVQLADRIDTGRDLLSGLQDVYLSTLSNRTNTVMKIVAVFSSVFLPLTFITGVFGMNFEFMPLIHRPWGFALSAVAMLAIVFGMLGYFRYKHWI